MYTLLQLIEIKQLSYQLNNAVECSFSNVFFFVIDQCIDDICIDEMLKCDKEIDCRDHSDKSAQYTGCGGQHICYLILFNFLFIVNYQLIKEEQTSNFYFRNAHQMDGSKYFSQSCNHCGNSSLDRFNSMFTVYVQKPVFISHLKTVTQDLNIKYRVKFVVTGCTVDQFSKNLSYPEKGLKPELFR